MNRHYTTIEELLSDDEFLTAYDGRHGPQQEKWQQWVDWMSADPTRAALVQRAIHVLDIIRLAENPEPVDMARLSLHGDPGVNRLLRHVAWHEEQRRFPDIRRARFLLRNHLRAAIRNFLKEKSFAAINILGLALGLAVCLLITVYVTDELSFDRFNTRAGRIYRLQTDISYNGNSSRGIATPAQMGPTLVKDYPQVQQYVRIGGFHSILVKKGNTTITEPQFLLADSTIFDVFTLPLICGNPHTALSLPSDMVISQDAALKLFNTVNCLGRTLHINNEKDFTITGVMKDMPAQSHFHARFIAPMSGSPYSRNTEWLSNDFITYVLLRPGATKTDLGLCLDRLTANHIMPVILHRFFHDKAGHFFDQGDNHYRFYAMPLTDIHLHSHEAEEFGDNGNIKYIYIFILIGAFILLIACVNFMNLSTARSARRAREVGIRKVLGSLRTQLIGQFLTESMLTSTLAMVIAVSLSILLLPWLNRLSGKDIGLSFLSKDWLLPWIALTTLTVGLLAGIYPAFYLSAFRPVQVLKGRLTSGFRSGALRNGLVVFQFTIAILLIIGTGVIYRQLSYIRHKDLGYNREQVLVIRNTYSLWIYARQFKDQVKRMPGVLGATMTFFLPNETGIGTNTFFKDQAMSPSRAAILTDWPIDADYVPTLAIKMAAGRNFSPQFPTDSSAALINETAQQLLGYDDPIGKTIYQPEDSGRSRPFRIIGVVKDFQPASLHSKIPPMLFKLREERGALAVRIRTDDIPGLIARIEKAFRSYDKMADQPFPWYFMDEAFDRLYQDDQRTGALFISFAALAIFIGCLGLFGLITYAAEQRSREISIRKVLGASAVNIFSLLSKEFIILTAISALIAFPIGGWAMYTWLQSFAYRTDIGWWIFALAAALAIGISFVTISFQAIRAARANPLLMLRQET